MCEIVADATAVLNVVQQLANKALVGVPGQFALELERLYGSDQLLLVNGRRGSPSPHGLSWCTLRSNGESGMSGAAMSPY